MFRVRNELVVARMYLRKVVTLLDLLFIYRQFVVYIYNILIVLINTTFKLLYVANCNLPGF